MTDIALVRRALAIAKQSIEQGNLPFGCLLADTAGTILEEAGNTAVTEHCPIAHSEINLVQRMAGKYDPGFLLSCTVYASAEPCPMCAGALYWSGVGRIVFALDKESYHAISQTSDPAFILDLSCKAVLEKGGRKVEVVGPVLLEEATAFYKSITGQ